MTRTAFWKFVRDPETDDVIDVEFSYSGGCAAHYGSMNYPGHPGEAPEIEIVGTWRELADGKSEPVTLTDEECQRCETDITENWEDDEDDYDPYDDRI